MKSMKFVAILLLTPLFLPPLAQRAEARGFVGIGIGLPFYAPAYSYPAYSYPAYTYYYPYPYAYSYYSYTYPYYYSPAPPPAYPPPNAVPPQGYALQGYSYQQGYQNPPPAPPAGR